MIIPVLIPTRGTLFTETADWLITQLRFSTDILDPYFTTDLPIPTAQNTLLDKVLGMDTEYILFLEEDIVPPAGKLQEAIDAMSDKKVGLVCVDYVVGDGQSTVWRFKDTNEIAFCALGFSLVRVDAIKKLAKPYFRTDKMLRLNDLTWIPCVENSHYGLLDVYFTWNIREAGYKIVQLEGECRHLKIETRGKEGQNDGCHKIVSKGTVTNHLTL